MKNNANPHYSPFFANLLFNQFFVSCLLLLVLKNKTPKFIRLWLMRLKVERLTFIFAHLLRLRNP